MALSIGEANAAATLIHILQADTRPAGVQITPERATDAVQLLTSKVHKTLLAGPAYDETAVHRGLAALQLLPGLVDDLQAMVQAGAIYLETWPNARALIEAYVPESSPS